MLLLRALHAVDANGRHDRSLGVEPGSRRQGNALEALANAGEKGCCERCGARASMGGGQLSCVGSNGWSCRWHERRLHHIRTDLQAYGLQRSSTAGCEQAGCLSSPQQRDCVVRAKQAPTKVNCRHWHAGQGRHMPADGMALLACWSAARAKPVVLDGKVLQAVSGVLLRPELELLVGDGPLGGRRPGSRPEPPPRLQARLQLSNEVCRLKRQCRM